MVRNRGCNVIVNQFLGYLSYPASISSRWFVPTEANSGLNCLLNIQLLTTYSPYLNIRLLATSVNAIENTEQIYRTDNPTILQIQFKFKIFTYQLFLYFICLQM